MQWTTPAGKADGPSRCRRRGRRSRLDVALGISLAILPAALQAQSITFTVIGDVPYDDTEMPILQQHIVNHNLYSPGEFMVHVGDIFGGGVPCEEYRYQQVADVLKQLAVPAVVLPGDNETKDCDDPAQGWTFWTTHFLNFESFFCSNLAYWHQTGRPENIAFVSKGVLFIGIHLVGGSNPSAILQDDAAWVEQHLLQQAPFVRAAVVLAQAGPGSGDAFFDQFVPDAVAFGKPVLYIHGNGHSWIDDMPFGAPNIRRIQVERGTKPPVAITVTTDAVPVFLVDRNPFDGTAVNMAPCVNAGPDLAIGIAQQAWLRGEADDDGDPGSASLALTWSKLSGPGTVTFTSPGAAETAANFSVTGTYVLRLRASDGLLISTDLATVTVSVTPPGNDPPVVAFDSYSTLMQRTLTVPAPGVLANDSDPNGTAISAVLASGPTHGTLTLNANGGFTYTPQASFYGLDGFTYRASDGSLQSSIANVTLNVTPLTLTLTPAEDGTGNSSSPGNPSGSGSSLRVEADVTSYRSFLKFTVAGVGTSVYRAKLRLFVTNGSPDGGSLYRVSNYFPGTTTAWTEETLNWANMPVITGTAIGSAGAVDADDFVEFDVTTAIRGDGTYSFGLKNASTNNVEYSSKEGEESPVLVIETLPGGGGANGVPVAVDNSYTVAEDGSLAQAAPGVLANDSDANGDPLTVVLTAAPAHGTLALTADGGFTYTPAPNYNGTDSFSYVADDWRGSIDPAVVTLTVSPVNDAPVAADESYATDEDVPVVVASPGLRANDTDIDGDALSTSVVTLPAHGTLLLAADGSFTYTPALDWNGSDGFTYAVSDGKGGSDTAAVTLAIAPVEDAPRAADDDYTTGEDAALGIAAPGFLGNDSDPEGDPISATLATPAAHGTLVLGGDGSFTYTPSPNFYGADSFGYLLKDAKGGTDAGTVRLVIAPVNDTPVARDDAHATSEDVPLVVPPPGLLANDSDIDGDVLVATVAVAPAHGSVVLDPGGGFTYTPAVHFNGSDAFTYEVNDGHGGTVTATATITVAPVNDAPAAVVDRYATPEDTGLVVPAPGVLGNDGDPDGDALSVVLLVGPAQGQLSLGADGSFTYAPPPDFNGSQSFTYVVSDGAGGEATGTATLLVEPVNDTPVAADDVHMLDEDQTLTLASPGILANDADVDGDPLSAGLLVPPAHGTLALAPNGGLTYVPHLDFVGTDGFTYGVSDASTAADTARVTFVLRAVNDPPVAVSDVYDANEDAALAVAAPGLLGNDHDVDGDALSTSVVVPPAHGLLLLDPDGGFTYTPARDFSGADGFSYSLSDAKGGLSLGAVTISVAPSNDAPVAGDDTDTTLEDVPLSRPAPGLLGNDTDVDGDVLTAVVATLPAHGTLQLRSNGGFTYVPAPDYHGPDGFTYVLVDAANVMDTGSVTLTIAAVNDAPEADTDGYVTSEDLPLVVQAPGVLGNDRDVDGEVLTATVGAPPAHGTLVLHSDGGFRYVPGQDFNGTDTFAYQSRDPSGATDTETVVLYIAPRNDAPAAGNDTYATDEDVVLTVPAPGLLGNDSDVDGDALTTSLASPPAHGTVLVTTTGGFTYTPAADFFGNDSFTYTLRDALGATTTGTVLLTVRAVNDAPVAARDAYATDEDIVLTVPAPGLLGNDSDVDGDALHTRLLGAPARGTVQIGADGSFTYVPAADMHGEDSFTYLVEDSEGGSTSGSVTLMVLPVNDPPLVADDTYAVEEDNVLALDAPGLLSNDTDVDGDALTSELAQPPAHGAVRLDASGSFRYTPAANYYGADTFSYVVDDGRGGASMGTVTLAVTPVNDAPVAADHSFDTDEDVTLVIAAPGVLDAATDADADTLTAVVVAPPAHGALTLATDGSFTYTPAPDFFGSDAFTLAARDAGGGSDAATITLTVRPLPDAPVAVNDAHTLAEDDSLDVASPGLLGNDRDADGDVLVARLGTPAVHGVVHLEPDGSFSYVPAPDYYGTDTFTYVADDGSGRSTTASVALTVGPVNDVPIAAADAYTLVEDTPLALAAPGPLANDHDVDAEELQALLLTPPAHGALVLRPDGGFSYTPAADFHGGDVFVYAARDAAGAIAAAMVQLEVTAANDAPRPGDDAFSVSEDDTLTITAPGLLGNDVDVEGEALTAMLSTPPEHGSVALTSDGGFRYTPATDFSGDDGFTYAAQDASGAATSATVRLRVTPVNDAPQAVADSFVVAAGTGTLIAAPGVLGNDVDVDGDSLRAVVVAAPQFGQLDLHANGAFVYTPFAGYTGPDTYTYGAEDGHAADVTTVALHVEGRGVTYHESAAGAAAAQLELQTEGALAAVAGDLYLAAISTQPFRAAARVTGMNLNWTHVRGQCGARGDTGVELWMARGNPSPGVVMAAFETPVDHAALVVSRYSGADPVDPLGMQIGGNSYGLEANCSGGPDGMDYRWRAPTLTEDGILYRALAMRDRTHATSDGAYRRWRIAQGMSAATASLDVDDRAVDAGDHLLSGSFSQAVDWAALAVEIRSARVDDHLRLTHGLNIIPNPFTKRTVVQYTLFRRAPVTIQIFDVRGRMVRRLLQETRPPGRLQLDWDATDARGRSLDSGVYFLRLQSEGRTLTRKIVLLK